MCPVWIIRLWVPFQPITAPYFPLFIKPGNFAKRQVKLQSDSGWPLPQSYYLFPQGEIVQQSSESKRVLSELLSDHAVCWLNVEHFYKIERSSNGLTVFCEVMGTGRPTGESIRWCFFGGTNFGCSEAKRTGRIPYSWDSLIRWRTC